MYEETAIRVREGEGEELYVLLLSQESGLAPKLQDLKRRLEGDLYRRHSIAEMEELTERAGNDRN